LNHAAGFSTLQLPFSDRRLFLGCFGDQAKLCASKCRILKKDVDLNPDAFTVRPPSPQQEATFGSLRVHFLCDNTAYRISQTLHLVNPAITDRGFYQN
jgi:hypothetical protein